MDADPESELDAELRLHSRGMLGEDLLHPNGTAKRSLGVVLVSDRSPKDHEDRVADELLDRAVVPEGLLGEVFKYPGDEHLQLLRVEVLGERREAHEVGEQDRHQTALLMRARVQRFWDQVRLSLTERATSVSPSTKKKGAL